VTPTPEEVLESCWEQVHSGDPNSRETWTNKTLRWVCIWCAHDKPKHGKECPIPALATSQKQSEEYARLWHRDAERVRKLETDRNAWRAEVLERGIGHNTLPNSGGRHDTDNPVLFCWRCNGERPYKGESYGVVRRDPSWHTEGCPVREAFEAMRGLPDWAPALRGRSTAGAEGEQGLKQEGGVQDRPTEY